MRCWTVFILIAICWQTSVGQNAPVSADDSVSSIKVDVKLVPVHVVVRDGHGQAVGNLHKEDFQIFDRDKLQVVTQFSAEHTPNAGPSSAHPEDAGAAYNASPRYTAYLFDDLHLERNDLMQARQSADRRIAMLSPATERAAIFTTSGQKGIDFTADRAKLHDTLMHIEPRIRPIASDCPNISYYLADLIANKEDEDALSVAAKDALSCAFDGSVKASRAARQLAKSVAREKAATGKVETERSLRILKALAQGMSKAPGQRTILIISPGFFVTEDQGQVDILDLAVRNEITVSALDPRGLIPSTDISGPGGGSFDASRMAYKSLSDMQEQAVLGELADGTGGIFFHNNNDVDEGFRRVAATPEYSYVLAFSPRDVKFDGRFHKLKIMVNNGSNLTVQARKGYYAPKKNP